MDFVKADFSYCARTIERMYKKYYFKRLIVAGILLVVSAIYTFSIEIILLLNILLLFVLTLCMYYCIQKYLDFKNIYQQLLAQKLPEAAVQQIEEDEHMRNLPSNNKQLTMMVGFSKMLAAKMPLQMEYYDMPALTYEEKIRLRKNGYRQMPHFLRQLF